MECKLCKQEYERGFIDGSGITGEMSEEYFAIKIKEAKDEERARIKKELLDKLREEVFEVRTDLEPSKYIKVIKLTDAKKAIDKKLKVNK